MEVAVASYTNASYDRRLVNFQHLLLEDLLTIDFLDLGSSFVLIFGLARICLAGVDFCNSFHLLLLPSFLLELDLVLLEWPLSCNALDGGFDLWFYVGFDLVFE